MSKNNQIEIAKQLDSSILAVLGSNAITGFEKAYIVADAVSKLKDLLTTEYMKPIMQLQGNRLGFRTDKDASGGYPEAVVKNCVIEATLMGVQVCGNHFNIIAGNCYITKEGFGYLLANIHGLKYDIVPMLPRIKDGSAAVVMKITGTFKGVSVEKEIDFPIKVNQHMGADAVIGKATRKARAWLHSTITGVEYGDGEVENGTATVISSRPLDDINKEEQRKLAMISDCNTLEEVDTLAAANPDWDALLFDARKDEIKNGSGK